MKTRTISAAIMITICLPFILIGKTVFAVGVGLLGLLVYREIINLKKDGEKHLPMVVVFSSLISFLFIIYSNYGSSALWDGLNYNRIALCMLITLVPVLLISNYELYSPSRALSFWGLLFLVGLGLNVLITIRNEGIWLFIYLVSVTISTDTFAYLTGRLVGKHKCSKMISPNKTWEGCIGGSLIGTMLSSTIYMLAIGQSPIINVVLVTLALTIIGQLGDLFFSSIKREYHLKDFSNLIPGHGGALDRIDSIIFVVIAYLMFHIYL